MTLSLQERDKKYLWHPFTQEKTAADVLGLCRARGSYVYDEKNRAYLDLISSWWVNLHGHGHPQIAEAIHQQAKKLEHIIFSGHTHEPAVTLCENLHKILPSQLRRFFYSDNGSTAVEVALKMAYQYWHNSGFPEKKVFLSFQGGYHGDTFGAMSVSQCSHFHGVFSDLFFQVIALPYPETWQGDSSSSEKVEHALAVLEKTLVQHSRKIAALILEPLVQGAGGMRLAPPSFFKKVVKAVRNHNILVIFDEVMTGFGRTGTHWALTPIDVVPDFLCLSKGLTGGFLPLALTVTQEFIYEAFLHQEWRYAFSHGHSYTANPLACCAAIASLKLLQSNNCQRAIQMLTDVQKDSANQLLAHSPIEKLRTLGTIAAFDLQEPLSACDFKKISLQEGLLLRPLGRTVYLLPPYSTSEEALRGSYEKIADILKHRLNKSTR